MQKDIFRQSFKKITGINLLVLMVFTLIFSFVEDAFAMGKATAILIIAVSNLLLAIIHFIKKKQEHGAVYLLNILVVGLIGFSLCLGIEQYNGSFELH